MSSGVKCVNKIVKQKMIEIDISNIDQFSLKQILDPLKRMNVEFRMYNLTTLLEESE
jgi:hypothetical protein